MVCPVNKKDSSIVGLAYAEEECVKVLPDATPESGLQDGGTWYPLEPNEYSDFGGNITTLVRNPINASRQRQKGVVADLEAAGGFTQDLTQKNLARLMQGFLFADAHERATTIALNTSTTVVALEDMTATATFEVGVGEGAEFKVGDILKFSGFDVAANNIDEVLVTVVTGDVITTDATFAVEVVDALCKIEKVGYQFVVSQASITTAGGILQLTDVGTACDTLDCQIGEWIYITQSGTHGFVNNGGYARVKAIVAGSLTLELPTWTPQAEATPAVTIRIYFGTFLRNEKETANIVTRTYQLERQLGEDAVDVQSEYLVGAVANEFTLNLATADKVTCDMSFMALDNELRDGTTGIKLGTRAALEVETAFNTSSDVPNIRLFEHSTNIVPTLMFAYVMDGSISIKNNVTAIKAIGQLGGFDTNVGDFEVGGELNVFFATIDAVQAIKDNASVGLNMILAKENAGMVFDIPLLTLGGKGIGVVANEPIKMALEQFGAENEEGYTIGITYFSYLPAAAY